MKLNLQKFTGAMFVAAALTCTPAFAQSSVTTTSTDHLGRHD